MKRCFDCVFCSSFVSYPFADVCDIDNHIINDVYADVCEEFIDSSDDSIMEDYATLLKKACASRERRVKQ